MKTQTINFPAILKGVAVAAALLAAQSAIGLYHARTVDHVGRSVCHFHDGVPHCHPVR